MDAPTTHLGAGPAPTDTSIRRRPLTRRLLGWHLHVPKVQQLEDAGTPYRDTCPDPVTRSVMRRS